LVTATITSKGQITIPAKVRASLGIAAGDRVEFIELEKGQFAIIASKHPVQDLKGLIRKPPKPVSIEDMNAAITK
jgi:AbrB family looped-hinge helix DNA binding protein|tara:strand:+ start:282 stop:506 length:225 start_codon:yes stop_codon:yes gene_type:complete